MTKAETLRNLAQAIADERPSFFEIKGPSVGDKDTGAFMLELRRRAREAFGADYAEKMICGANRLCVDYYFPDEGTIVEIAFGLRNPTSEFERDVLKAVMAQEAGQRVTRLFFVSKPGAIKRCAQPGARAVMEWVERKHGIAVQVQELKPRHSGAD